MPPLRAVPFLTLLILPISLLAQSSPDSVASIEVSIPAVVLRGVGFSISIRALDARGKLAESFTGPVTVSGVLVRSPEGFSADSVTLIGGTYASANAVAKEGAEAVTVRYGTIVGKTPLRSIPGILSILPPLLAIVLALVLRQVIISLVAGVWLGALFMSGENVVSATFRVVDHFVVNALSDPDHVAIITFSMLFGGMVGIISKNGGTFGIADKITRMAKTPRMGQFSAWLLGIVIFFDDYANTLIVGNTMRPITDKLRISREKLAYIVDSTAAPVSSLFFISTWIGYEVGLIDSAIKSINYHVENAYWIFIDSLPFRFYPILTLVLGFLITATRRDFGPMLRAERRSNVEGKLYRDGAQLATDLTELSSVIPSEGIPRRWFNGALPILTIIVVGIIGLYTTGYDSIAASGGTDFSVGNIIGSSDSYRALLWASLTSCLVALIMTLTQRILTVHDTMGAWFNGVKSMLLAMIILILAWSIGEVTKELHTADYMVQILRGNLAVQWLPVLTFLISAAISFATGTSWGTMGIVMPIVIPLAAALSLEAGSGLGHTHLMMLGTVSSVLAGAVFGDHCSPISDTTILSSMASACDHIDHVRTQLPYAVVVAFTGMLAGDIPTAFGLSPWISIFVGVALLAGVIYVVGKKV